MLAGIHPLAQLTWQLLVFQIACAHKRQQQQARSTMSNSASAALAATALCCGAAVHALRRRFIASSASVVESTATKERSVGGAIAEEVLRAVGPVSKYTLRTPVARSAQLSKLSGADVYVKLESEQVTGSFKARGAVHKVHSMVAASASGKLPHITTASTGNHALAVTRAVRLLAPESTFEIFVPANASPAKLEALAAAGAKVTKSTSNDCERAEVEARQAAESCGGVFVSPYNDVQVAAGQGTIAVELLEQLRDLQCVLVPVGGGGMIAGIAAYIKHVAPHVQVIGCQPVHNACMYASLQAGRILGDGEFENGATWSDGTAGGIEAGAITVQACKECVDDWLLVEEDAIEGAMVRFMREQHKIIEGSAGVALAAFECNAARFAGQTVAIVCCGSNLPMAKVASLAAAAAQ